MITSNGRIIKKTYCSNCFGIIMWDDVADEKSQMGHRMIQCPKCGKEEQIIGDDVITIEADIIENPKAYINNIAYETTEEALNALQSGDNITLLEDLTLNSLKVPAKSTIDFNGHTVTLSNSIIPAADSTLKNGIINFTSNGDGLAISNKGTVTLDNMDITTKRNGVSVTESKLILNNSKIKAQEAAIFTSQKSTVEINGGTYTTIDNGVVMDNGSAGRQGNKIIINDGEFNGNITSAGYLAHVIYLANNDIIEINGGTFNVSNGSAIVVRGGSLTVGPKAKFNVSGDISGKVGDGALLIPAGHEIVVDKKSKYPAVNSIKVKAPGRDILQIQDE